MKQEEYFGFGSITNLKSVLEKLNPKKIFLVTGKRSYSDSGAEEKLSDILSACPYMRFSGFEPNPKIEDIKKGIKLIREGNCDLVIGVGGGSVIDTAKAINILSSQTEKADKPEDYITKKKRIMVKGRPLVAIPTTSGSGSEATHFAVAYIDGRKHSLSHDYILPDISIIDPQFTLSLPKKITACTGMDAFCQAVESYWSVNSDAVSKRYAKEAITLTLKHLIRAVKSPCRECRSGMAMASNLSGKAINISKTTAAHALSYSVTTRFNVPHGHAASLTLGEFMEYNFNVNDDDVTDKRGACYVKETIKEIASILGYKEIKAAKDAIYDMMEEIGLETRLSKLGIDKEGVSLISDEINLERAKNNPRALTKESVKSILLSRL